MDSSSLSKLPTVDKLIVYLDYNIFALLLNDKKYYDLFLLFNKTDIFNFPFTYVHINEVRNITGPEKEINIQKHLDVISEISASMYLDFNESVSQYTLRPRSPHEVYETMNEIPEDFIDKLHKEQYELNKDSLLLPEGCYRPEDQYAHFAKQFRSYYPELSKQINNLSKSEAIEFIEKNLYKGMTLKECYQKMCLINDEAGVKNLGFEFFVENNLAIAGYRTPGKEFKNPKSLMLDHQHLYFLKNCKVVISEDSNFRKKVSDFYKEKNVLNLEQGVQFLGDLALRIFNNQKS